MNFSRTYYGGKFDLWIEFGWFSGEDFRLFDLSLLENYSNSWQVFSLKVFKFAFNFGFDINK
jgi:hypothetical protein